MKRYDVYNENQARWCPHHPHLLCLIYAYRKRDAQKWRAPKDTETIINRREKTEEGMLLFWEHKMLVHSILNFTRKIFKKEKQHKSLLTYNI